ncbi:MAG: hypothetical protein M1825_005093 [Sarcosagium campestre]|nr:MAG: hypothetical protein M1825_005093 [Sarcosagium campestre]
MTTNSDLSEHANGHAAAALQSVPSTPVRLKKRVSFNTPGDNDGDSSPSEDAFAGELGQQPTLHDDNLPHRPKSLSGISLRAFLLGNSLGLSLSLTVYLLSVSSPYWPTPFFLTCLSLFHFLEFWTTARFNTRHAAISAFLFNNGVAYNIAHTAAIAECLVVNRFFPSRAWMPVGSGPFLTLLGLLMVGTGQVTRSVAMAQAGTSFNHIVQTKRDQEHKLVTHGIYGYLRHPSYFGFFWWGLGTQVVLGNGFCFLGYAIVLWRFFSRRIRKEEVLLVSFFGQEYEEYRWRTLIGIPFI